MRILAVVISVHIAVDVADRIVLVPVVFILPIPVDVVSPPFVIVETVSLTFAALLPAMLVE